MFETQNDLPQILIVDDEESIRNLLSDILRERHRCSTAATAEDALLVMQDKTFDLVISDINLGATNGFELIPQIFEASPDTVVLMISGNSTIDSAIEAIRCGAFDYIKKPFDIEHIEIAVRRALEHQSLLVSKRRHENHLEELVKQRTEQLHHLSYHDALTDLPNRVLFEDRCSQALLLAGRKCGIGVLHLFIDRFKEIEDTLGYAAGRKVVREVASRLQSIVDESATVARFEGGEFGVLLNDVKATQDLIEAAEAINKALHRPFIVGENEVYATASIGISLFPNDGADAQSLLKNAGVALSRAREKGGNAYQFFTGDMNAQAVKRLTLENNLRRALEREEFEVYYQPKIDLKTKTIVGMEALARWQQPECGFVSPMEFIPLAEETGLIVPLGEWILRAACEESKKWIDAGFDLTVAVNLSARQFRQQNLTRKILRIVEEKNLDPHNLNLEVTESSIMLSADASVKTLADLKETGIKISIDDFGTGYSSLGYLKRLPIDVLKIDRSFVRDVTTNADDASLVTAIVTLAHNLRLKVVAEGVETEEQLEFLQSLSCDEFQGYLFSKPVCAADFGELLEAKKFAPAI